MVPENDDTIAQDKIKKLLGNPPSYKLPEAKRREFIARLYNISEERRKRDGDLSGWRIPQFATVLSSVLLIFMFYNYALVPMYPSICDVKGTVKIYRSVTNEWVFVKNDKVRLYKNDILKTFDDGQADILVQSLYHIRVKNNAEIKLAQAPSRAFPNNISYELNKGKAYANYNKFRDRNKNRELVIQTPQASATALGTDFMVETSMTLSRTWVGVLEGVVRVRSSNIAGARPGLSDTVFVKPGEKTVVKQGVIPTKPNRLMESEMLEMEELYGLGAKPQVALLISSGPTRTRELLSLTPLYISAEKPGILPEKIKRVAGQFNKAIREGSKETHLDNIREFEDIVENYPNPKYDVQFLLFIAAYYEYLNEHDKAIETFRKVVEGYPRSTLSSVAECAIGIIYEEKLKEPDVAKSAYQKVLRDYPASPETEEAVAGLDRLTKISAQ